MVKSAKIIYAQLKYESIENIDEKIDFQIRSSLCFRNDIDIVLIFKSYL